MKNKLTLLILIISFFSFSCDNNLFKSKSKQNANSNEIKNEEDVVYTIVEDMPYFPGGEAALFKFLGENIKYPKEAKDAEIEGVVYITFIVKKDGEVGGVKVLKGIGGGCDEEALRVVNMMPTWKPGVQKGKPVDVQYNLPIRFKLNKPKDDKQENIKN